MHLRGCVRTAGQQQDRQKLTGICLFRGADIRLTFRGQGGLQPADCEQIELSSLVLGKASFADFDPLFHPCFRLTDSCLWVELTNPKLGKAILHIAKGWPVSPVLLSVHEYGGFYFGGGTHRYQVLKRSGTPHFYFLSMPDDVTAINKQLTVQWMSG